MLSGFGRFRNPPGFRYAKLCQAGGRVFARVMRTDIIGIGIPVRISSLARLTVRFCGLRFPVTSCAAISRSRVFAERRSLLASLLLHRGIFLSISVLVDIHISRFSFARFQSKIPRKSQSSRMHELRNALASRTHRGYG